MSISVAMYWNFVFWKSAPAFKPDSWIDNSTEYDYPLDAHIFEGFTW